MYIPNIYVRNNSFCNIYYYNSYIYIKSLFHQCDITSSIINGICLEINCRRRHVSSEVHLSIP